LSPFGSTRFVSLQGRQYLTVSPFELTLLPGGHPAVGQAPAKSCRRDRIADTCRRHSAGGAIGGGGVVSPFAVLAGVLLQIEQLLVHVIQLGIRKGLVYVSELVWVYVQVVVGYDAGYKFAVQVVVGGVDGPHAGVSVGVRVGTRAERALCP